MSTETYYGTETVVMTWLRSASKGDASLDQKLKDSGWTVVDHASTSLSDAITSLPVEWDLEVLEPRGTIWHAEAWKYDINGKPERKVSGLHKDQKLAILVACEIINIGSHKRGEHL